jgi:acetate kinase
VTTRPDRSCVLTINAGSSSLKFALCDSSDPSMRLLSGKIERIGFQRAQLVVTEPCSAGTEVRDVNAPDHRTAVDLLTEWLDQRIGFAAIAIVGHRVVHGGSRYSRPERITPELIDELRRISTLDPDHLPAEIELIEAFGRIDTALPQVACFDTAFHHDMPRVAQIVAIPRRYEATGVRRYGFHGLSYAYLMEELERVAGWERTQGRVILAHLGAGASLAAVRGGRCVDTTMGFTPTSGLVMATRSGDLDPGLVWFLAQADGMSAEQFHRLVNHDSGLIGVSETSSDLRDLLARQGTDARAAEAVELFCYQAKKWIGAFAALLGGLDTLVFSGGIGENAPEVRHRICEGLQFLGITLDDGRNTAGAPIISPDGGTAEVRVIRTDEELMIAKAAADLIPRSS